MSTTQHGCRAMLLLQRASSSAARQQSTPQHGCRAMFPLQRTGAIIGTSGSAWLPSHASFAASIFGHSSIMDLPDFYKAYAPKIPGRILLCRVGGSQSYNTNTPSSDTDFLGVYAAWTEDVLSLTPPQDTIASAEGTKPDYTVHEVKKFCSLLMSGNPTVLEFIFSDKFQMATAEWIELASNKKIFLTCKAVKNYIGYAKGQVQRMLKGQSVHGLHGKPNEKFSYHIIRLLNDAKEIAL